NKQLAIEFREFLRAKGFHHDIVELETLVGLVKERVNFVKDIWNETDFFFRAPETFDQAVVKKRWKSESPVQLMELRQILNDIPDFTAAATEAAVKEWIAQKNYNIGDVMNAFRLVLVGASRGPHIFDIIAWLGKDETLKRIERGVSIIGNTTS
ncbi:MAG: glutamate--tRNA ligase, partial [Bacteroidales bacterium]|nr:glutamate--tRNA ligase [Bacteroidales bacterium]